MKKAYFIGIAGAGMSAVAKLLKDKGWKVSGSDENCYPPISDYLNEQKIPYKIGYNKNNLPQDADLIVLGMNAKLRADKNTEVKTAIKSNIEIKSFPEILSDLSKNTENIIVAGSYAKSTCTAMLVHCMENANKNPNYFIGAVPVQNKITSKINKDKNNVFIIEGDEYPADRKENKSKFLYLKTDNVLLTAAEHDHINIFPTITEYLKPFKKLIKKIPKNGFLISCIDNPNTEILSKKCKSKIITYGLKKEKNPIWFVDNIKYGKISSFDVFKKNKKITTLKTKLLGKHNIQNILGATAMLLEKKLITVEELKNGMKTFQGIKRRLELKSTKSKIPVYEGFGSSYDKARSAIEAMKIHFPEKKLIIVFEPHAFSWRNKEKLYWYNDVFKDCEKVFICSPPTQGADTHSQLTLNEIIDKIKTSGTKVEEISNHNGKNKLEKYLKLNHSILLLSSGNLDNLVKPIINLVETKFNKKH